VIRERADQVCPARHVSERAEDTWILCHEDVPRLLTVAQVADEALFFSASAKIAAQKALVVLDTDLETLFAILGRAIDAEDAEEQES
jgi:hypothetical protein